MGQKTAHIYIQEFSQDAAVLAKMRGRKGMVLMMVVLITIAVSFT